jgi:carbonic anhydrase/acetyltransferase-like protein (isoleucine patch superfamily)
MGATLLNGVKVGQNCLIGANALITEGKEFPNNSLIVGTPARAIRTIDERGVAALRLAAESYISRWPKYAAGFSAVD